MGKIVLVVDDSDETRLMLLRMLQGEGYSSLEARNGVEALAKVDEYCPDLIIMDLYAAPRRAHSYRAHSPVS